MNAILLRLENDSNSNLSVQGEINCLIILSKRNKNPWSEDQIARVKAVLTALESKELTPPEQYAVRELNKTLEVVQPNAIASPSA